MAKKGGPGPRTKFQPGQSGNPAGGKPQNPELVALAKEHSVEAMQKIIAVMRKIDADDQTVLKAAQLIIERGHGKAPQVVQHENYDVMTDAELRKRLDAAVATARAYGVDLGGGAGKRGDPAKLRAH